MKLSLSQISTVSASLEEDLEAYAAAGFEGIGLWEMKLGADDEAALRAVRASGLTVTNCVPATPSILPIPAVIPGPEDVEERVEALCASMHRLAAFAPSSVVCLTGPADRDGARELVVDGLRRVGAAARAAGVRLGLEPVHASQQDLLTLVTSVPDALALLDEAGLDDVGVMLDLYHVWDTPTIAEDIRAHVGRFTGVHVSDWPAEPGRTDRVLPGEGVSRTAELVALLDAAGWDGFYDVEIFSDAERFWGLSAAEAARRAHAAMARLHA